MSTIGGVPNSGDSHQSISSRNIDPNRELLASSEGIKQNFQPSVAMNVFTMENLTQHQIAKGFSDPTANKIASSLKTFFS